MRRSTVALVVASRLWSASLLAPTILTAGLAAPPSALALTVGNEPPQGATAAGGEPSAPPPPSPPTAEAQAGAAQTSAEARPLPASGTTAPVQGEPTPAAPGPSGGTPAGGEAETPPAAPARAAAAAPAAAPHKKAAAKHAHHRRHHRRHHHRRHHRRHHAKHVLKLHLNRAAARRTGGTQWAGRTRRRARPAGRAVISAAALPTGTLDAGSPVILPAGLAAGPSAPPAFLIAIYKQAGRRYHVPWRVLAAINWIETDYGRDLSVSSAGAIGWMQFMPATWRSYGGAGNPYDPHDAIFAAARYLKAAGATHDLRSAIFAYNHASWYVAAVLWRASTISTHAHASRQSAGRDGYWLPLDARFMRTLGRTDDGVDIETAPDGAAVYSITPGVVVAVASDPAGFGPNYPVVLATSGPLAGNYIYYGHVAASLVHVGEQVLAGQPVAIVGHTGDAAELGHGHIEIGFCDASGDPLDHHGAEAWTPSGQVMRTVLVSLSARAGVTNR